MNRSNEKEPEQRGNDGQESPHPSETQQKRERRRNWFALLVTTSYLWGLLLMLLGLMFYWFWTR